MTSTLDDTGDAATIDARAGARRTPRWDVDHPSYRWVALSNTTLGMLIATVNSSIVLISLPAIFRGIGMNPLAPENVGYLLWMIMGYLLVSAVLVVSLGRLGDLVGRVRMYNLGFAVFTASSVALALTPGSGSGAALWIIGVPLAGLWAVLSFLTNFVPNIGFLIGLVPPALLALLTGGVTEMLVVIGVYCVLNLVIQSLIQPRFVGDSVGLAMTTTFVALVFWAWLLGPLGALLAIPLTLLFKALLVDVDPTARWANALAGSLERPPRPPREHRRRRQTPSADPAPAGAGAGARAL